MEAQSAKSYLQEKSAEIQTRIAAIEKDLHQAKSQDFAEQATESENDEVLHNLLAESKLELKDIHTALQRIADGDYGSCISCGEDIDEKRLDARPEANTCIKCAA